MEIILIATFLVVSLIQLYFWLGRLDKLNRNHSKRPAISNTPRVSLVIAAKNEVHHLEKHLSKWLAQDYTNYEVIIINDHSSDGTRQILHQTVHDKLQVLTLEHGQSGKKVALTEGIAQAKGEWILVTDADCYPESKSWVSSMMSLSSGSDVILGYSPYVKAPGLLNAWIRYETWYVAIQYLSAALAKRAYMGVGRNMAFRKEVYDSVEGYKGHRDIRGGDDDLLIASLGYDYRYSIMTDKASWVWSYADSTFWSYINQKRRHLTTAPHYKIKTKLWLMAMYMSQLLWYISAVWLCFINPLWLMAVVFRFLIIYFVQLRSKEGRVDLNANIFSPVLDLLLCGFNLMLSITYLKPKKEW